MRLLVGLGFLEGGDLRFGQDQAVVGHLCFQRLEPMLQGLQVVAQPDRADAEGGDRHSLLGERVGDSGLAPGRLVDRHGYDRLFDLGRNPVLQDRLASRHLLERQLPAFVVEILEPVEAVPAVAHHLAGLADVAELLGQFEQAGLGANDFLILGHLSVSWSRHGGGCATPTSSAPATALIRVRNTVRQIKLKLSQL